MIMHIMSLRYIFIFFEVLVLLELFKIKGYRFKGLIDHYLAAVFLLNFVETYYIVYNTVYGDGIDI